VTQANRVAIRYKDGRVEKGCTHDFMPGKPVFHLHAHDSQAVAEVRVDDLKAIFFVKDLDGRPDYSEIRDFPETPLRAKGRKITILFQDGEILTGYTLTYDARRPGFFVMPTDEMSNNERVYVVRSAVKDVGIGAEADNLLQRNLSA
jgi:hypothetical protein